MRWWLLPPNDTSRVIFVVNNGEEAWDVPSGFSTRFDVSGVTGGNDK